MKKVKRFAKDYYPTVLIFVAVFLLYFYFTEKHILDRYLFPQVSTIAGSFADNSEKMGQNFLASFSILIPGVLIGVVISLAMGIPMGLNVRVRKVIHPIVYSVSMLPVILLSPFAVHMAPTLRAAGMFLVIWSTVWPLLFATINGIMTIDKRYLDNARTLELKGPKLLLQIIMPAALPSMAAGFVTSMRGALLSLVFAEMYGTKLGMGYFVKFNSDMGRFQHVWSGFLFLAFVTVIVMQLVEAGKNRMLHWTID